MIDAFFSLDTLLHPTTQFNEDVSKMYSIFCSIHPKNDISHEFGVVGNCVKEFKKHFPSHHDEVLHLTAQMFTFERLREVNEKFTQKKPKEAKKSDAIDHTDSEESEFSEAELEVQNVKKKAKKSKKSKDPKDPTPPTRASLPRTCRGITNLYRFMH